MDRLLRESEFQSLQAVYGRALTLRAVRAVLSEIRTQADPCTCEPADLAQACAQMLADWTGRMVPVINATGVILHTNLGRAPLSPEALAAIRETASNYISLEYDLKSGRRGSRDALLAGSLTRLTAAEDALVVNNNAAAVLLALSALAHRRQVVIARSQLVEIGGGFRIPDVLKQSGAKLVEIGTTNQLHLSDYRAALDGGARVVLRVHASNFKMIGFTAEPGLQEIAELAHRYEAIVIDDLGSGALLDTAQYGMTHEPTPRDSLQRGADLVSFSGDKLLGGPQAGILVGKAALVERMKQHPLARAVRADKLCLAGLQATLSEYEKERAVETIPVWQMIACPAEAIEARARYWQKSLDIGEVRPGRSTVGGGSLPEETLPTWLYCLSVPKPQHWLQILREQSTPIIARIEEDQVCFDLRTIFPPQDEYVLKTLAILLKKE